MKYFKDWMSSSVIDEESKKRARDLSPQEQQEAFYDKLTFGTAGLRGKLGPGTNRMNRYTVGLAVEAIARYIKDKFSEPAVVIGHDTRHGSREFANLAGQILTKHGVQVYLFKDLVPTPLLAYSVRYLKTSAGLMITASHNPRMYNGLKVYSNLGIQIGSDWAEAILGQMEALTYEDIALPEKVEELNLPGVPEDLVGTYFENHLARAIHEDIDKDLLITYTPLYGVGNQPVRHILKERGFTRVHVVRSQENPDPDFTTAPYPNPEFFEALKEAVAQADEEGSQVILATDPDCDRVSLAVKREDTWTHLNGNQIGALLMDYILHGLKDQGRLPKNGAVVKSIVTGDLGFSVAKDLGLACFESLTGFKNICAPVPHWKESGDYEFVFGYEESIGYIYGDDVYDKDGVISAMMLAEMAAYYHKRGQDLLDVLENLYKKYGAQRERLFSIQFEGLEGKAQMDKIMEGLRENPLEDLAGFKRTDCLDFKDGYKGSLDLDPQNLIRYDFENTSHIFFRPSGTEPKLKIYMYIKGTSVDQADDQLDQMEKDLREKLNEGLQ